MCYLIHNLLKIMLNLYFPAIEPAREDSCAEFAGILK